jgi:hypothetical protein
MSEHDGGRDDEDGGAGDGTGGGASDDQAWADRIGPS